MITEQATGLLMSFRESATATSTPLSPHLSCGKARRAASACATNCRQIRHWTDDLLDRLDRHAAGHGARLVTVIWHAGIGFTLVRICEGTRHTERAIRNAGGAPRYCPACTPRPWTGQWRALPADLVPRTYLNLAGRR
jgi:hypothetical protein